MTEQQIAVETGKAIEGAVAVPCTRSEHIGGIELIDIREEEGDCPQRKEDTLLMNGGFLDPCGEERQIEIEPYEHIEVPRVDGVFIEFHGYQGDVFQGIGERLGGIGRGISKGLLRKVEGRPSKPVTHGKRLYNTDHSKKGTAMRMSLL
jgi:hypothetical protein